MPFFDHLAAPFKQRGIVRGSTPAVAYGICVGLSVDWIIRHKTHKSEGTAKRIRYMGTQSPAQSVTAQLGYNVKLADTREGFGTGQTESINAAFETRRSALTVSDTEYIRHVSAAPDDAFASLFVNTSGVHCYYVILLQFDNGGDAHATAAYHSSGKVFGWGSHLYYFEPNFGEFKLPASAAGIKTFFEELAAQYLLYKDMAGTVVPKKLTAIIVNKVRV
ncbi:MAG: YopT-type cysteine protease domain-containing protein [Gemmataceae bacterium]